MIRPCPKCGKINSKDSLWCINCNSKLYHTINEPLIPKNTNEDEIFTKNIESSKQYKKNLPTLKIFLFTIITIGIVVMLIISLSFYLHQCPKDTLYDQLGDDFYYSDGKIVTADGIIYNLSDIQDYKFNGKIQDIIITEDTDCNPSPFEILTNLLGYSNTDKYNCSLTTVNDNQRTDLQILCNFTDGNICFQKLTENKFIFLNPEDISLLNSDFDIDDEIIIEGSIANIQESQTNNQDNISSLESSTEAQTAASQIVIVEKVIINKTAN